MQDKECIMCTKCTKRSSFVAVICITKYVFVYSSLTGNGAVHTVMDSKL